MLDSALKAKIEDIKACMDDADKTYLRARLRELISIIEELIQTIETLSSEVVQAKATIEQQRSRIEWLEDLLEPVISENP